MVAVDVGSAWWCAGRKVLSVRRSDDGIGKVPGVGVGVGDLAIVANYGVTDDDWKAERFVKIVSVVDRRVVVRVTGRCFDGEKNQTWTVPLESILPRR